MVGGGGGESDAVGEASTLGGEVCGFMGDGLAFAALAGEVAGTCDGDV
jgi:hypothetical protein